MTKTTKRHVMMISLLLPFSLSPGLSSPFAYICFLFYLCETECFSLIHCSYVTLTGIWIHLVGLFVSVTIRYLYILVRTIGTLKLIPSICACSYCSAHVTALHFSSPIPTDEGQ
jgi:hypothetical protein